MGYVFFHIISAFCGSLFRGFPLDSVWSVPRLHNGGVMVCAPPCSLQGPASAAIHKRSHSCPYGNTARFKVRLSNRIWSNFVTRKLSGDMRSICSLFFLFCTTSSFLELDKFGSMQAEQGIPFCSCWHGGFPFCRSSLCLKEPEATLVRLILGWRTSLFLLMEQPAGSFAFHLPEMRALAQQFSL